MSSVVIKSILVFNFLFATLAAFSNDINCKDENGKQVFILNFEKPLSSQISNKLGMRTVVLKGLSSDGERYSFIANSVIDENLVENHSLLLNGFGQVTRKSFTVKNNTSSLKNLTLRFPKYEKDLKVGSVEFIYAIDSHSEDQKIEFLNCHFDGAILKENKIYFRILEAFKIRK